MATTENRIKEIRELEELWERSPEARDTSPLPKASRLTPTSHAEVSQRFSGVLLAAWVAVLGVLIAFEPAPSNPDASIPLWGELLTFAFLAAFAGALMGLAGRKTWGVSASLWAAALGMAIAAACAATEHHAGGWWTAELAAFSALAGLSVLARRKAAPKK